MRFFLIGYISIGHFIACATKDAFVLKLLTQVNVVVGAFFVLSGYVAGYVATELRKCVRLDSHLGRCSREASLRPPQPAMLVPLVDASPHPPPRK